MAGLRCTGTHGATRAAAAAINFGNRTAYTVCAWVRITNTAANGVLAGAYNSGIKGQWYVMYAAGYFRHHREGGGPAIIGSTPVVQGAWYHVAGVYDGTNIHLYVNGVADGTPLSQAANVWNTIDIPWMIGGIYSLGSPAPSLVGEIFDVRAYNTNLSAARLRTIYCEQGRDTDTADLVARWLWEYKIDGTTASGAGSILDASASGLHATPYNSPTYCAVPIRLLRPRRVRDGVAGSEPAPPEPAGYTATGAGDSYYNGDYIEVGEHNGYPYYQKDGTGAYLYYHTGLAVYIMNGTLSDAMPIMPWYQCASADPTDTWTAVTGLEPPPTVTAS
jgi:hypothetical protein